MIAEVAFHTRECQTVIGGAYHKRILSESVFFEGIKNEPPFFYQASGLRLYIPPYLAVLPVYQGTEQAVSP